jgi:hypothetical protein
VSKSGILYIHVGFVIGLDAKRALLVESSVSIIPFCEYAFAPGKSPVHLHPYTIQLL